MLKLDIEEDAALSALLKPLFRGTFNSELTIVLVIQILLFSTSFWLGYEHFNS